VRRLAPPPASFLRAFDRIAAVGFDERTSSSIEGVSVQLRSTTVL